VIPADHISFNDDGTAWWIPSWPFTVGVVRQLDRPCDTCDGAMSRRVVKETMRPHGCIDGRHTFDIEVEADYFIGPMHHHILAEVHRVSVIPGMVLPIHNECPDEKPIEHVCQAYQDERWILHLDWKKLKIEPSERQIALPPAAAPGMWAVKLKVAQ
jgi:hypothetical protein